LRSGSYFASLAMAAFASLAFMPLSCTVQQPEPTSYFATTISPILTAGCVRANTGTGCHVADPKGNAFGNLDLSSFEGINRRRDLLQTYGPYPRPALLLKNIPSLTVAIQSFDGTAISVSTDIKHVGGAILNPDDTAYSTLLYWINNGASEFNTGPQPATLFHYPCTDKDPDMSIAPFNQSSFDATKIDTSSANYQKFTAADGPASIIKTTCGSGNCHGTASNELYFLCGNDTAQLEWNYFTASQYISNPPRDSEILRRPLDPTQGGSFHEGGVIFQGPSDPNYLAFLNWAVAQGPTPTSSFANVTPNLTFFADRVQPMLVKKGCMMLQCHSAAMFHDYRLRGGSGGSFSYAATVKNYELSLEQLGVDSPDFNASRIARKNLYRPEVAGTTIPTFTPGQDAGPPPTAQPLGMLHRGGPLFEDFGAVGPSECANATGWQTFFKDRMTNPNATPPNCCPPTGTPAGNPSWQIYQSAATTDPIDIPIPPYCMLKEWHERERAARGLSPLTAIIYVQRPPQSGLDRAQDFDQFAGGAELHIAEASIAPNKPVSWTTTSSGSPSTVLTTVNGVALGANNTKVDLTLCSGLVNGADVRRPMVSWDGTKFAFAARSTASDPLAVYEMDVKGTTCTKHALNTVTLPSSCSGSTAQIQNFDPAYAPDGSIVFASTRGNVPAVQGNFGYCGPQVTAADPSKPNANIYSYNPTTKQTTQLTYLLNMERHPSFMVDGRVIFTTEKREPNFYQLALRRENLDTGDYHPLYAQRGSIGYYQADQVVEMGDKSFAAIFSTCTPGKTAGTPATCPVHGGGVLGTFNRSLGVDFTSKNPADYPIDPTVIQPGSPTAPEPSFFLHSLRIPPLVVGASGTPGQTGDIYTTPSALPGGALLVSRSTAPADPGTFTGTYDLYVLDPETGAATLLLAASSGTQIVEAVGVYPRFVRPVPLPPVFASALDEPNGHTSIVPFQTNSDGVIPAAVTYLDGQVLASLLFQNTPTGRLIDPGMTTFDVYEDLPPDPGITSLSSSSPFIAKDTFGSVWVKRRTLGTVTLTSATDPSANVTLPGGVPLVIHLPDTPLSMAQKLPRWQREEIEYSPGEVENQVLPNAFFNGLCGQCHNAITGKTIDVAVNPDMLSQASNVAARTASPQNLAIAPSKRSTMYVPVAQIQ
jgi:hypothetical protein